MFSWRMARHRVAGDWYREPSPRALAARQEKAWRRLVRHAHARSPYYRRVMAEAGLDPATARPGDFPVLTKDALLAHYDEILTAPGLSLRALRAFLDADRDPRRLLDGRYYVIHTSGSSGAILPVVFDEAAWLAGCGALFRGFKPVLWERTLFVGATEGHFAGISMAMNHQRGVCPWFTRFAAVDVNQPLARLLEAVDAARPAVIIAYAGALRMLADAQRAGRIRLAPRALLSGGEALRAADARLIREAFGVAPMDVYATTEHLVMAWRPYRDAPWRFHADRLILETEATRTLVTNLYNGVLPLIRYVMGDVFGPDPDGGPATTVIGRQEHTPVFLNDDGERDGIHPIVLVEFYVPGLRAFQCRIRDERSFLFLIQCEAGLDATGREGVAAATHARLRHILDAKGMRGVSFRVQIVESLAPDPKTGKFRLILPPAAS